MEKRNNHDLVNQLAEELRWKEIETLFAEMHVADIAEIINRADDENLPRLFLLVEEDKKPEVLAELEDNPQFHALESLDSVKISRILDEMYPDDAADVLMRFSAKRSSEILSLMEDDESGDVRELMQYGEETAGGIMTTDFVSLPEHLSVDEALNRIAMLDEDEPFYYAYVVNSTDVLIGRIGLWEMIKMRNKDLRLADLVDRDIIASKVDMDQEECAHLMSKYDLSSLPVCDDDGRLVGRITVDDVIDVIEDEASEDIFRLAGSDDEELEHSSSLRAARLRLPWLLITLCTGFVTSLLLRKFIALQDVTMLVLFVPIIMAMGGNTGIQSSTLVVRRLAMGTLDMSDLSKILRKEIITGAIMGGLCGVAIAVWASIMFARGIESSLFSSFSLAGIVALALFSAMSFAAVFGAYTPMILSRFKIDPAIASGPFVTASNDILALLIYYGITVAFIGVFS